jgi:hypothetical protein
MAEQMIAGLIREVLAEELAKLRSEKGALPTLPSVPLREEQVAIANDADIAAFIQKILKLSEDPSERQKLKDGRIAFRLTSGATGGASGPAAAPAVTGQSHRATGQSHRIERGLLSERQVDRLPRQTKSVLIGKQVRMTPLARDRLRQRGIVIERME